MSSADIQIANAAGTPGVAKTVVQRYEALIELGLIEPLPAQRHLAAKLDELAKRLSRDHAQSQRSKTLLRTDERRRQNGLYIHGPPGGGKTMLLDMFFDSIELSAKRRMHIHELTAEYHQRVAAAGRHDDGSQAAALWSDVKVVCIDEMAISEIGDAAIVSRILTDLLARGTLLAMTANVAPDQLYEGGINRVLFTPLIRLLSDELEVVSLDPGQDFRRQNADVQPVWHVPADAAARAALDAAFLRLSGGVTPKPLNLAVRGHRFRVSGHASGVARFDFRELCLTALWTSDYRVLAQMFHTVIVDGIPARFAHRNHARRFCALIDVLHEFKVKLIASAAAEPGDLYAGLAAVLEPAIGPPSPTSETTPEVLEFRRTVSRLHEMRSSAYATLNWRGDIDALAAQAAARCEAEGETSA